MSEQPVRIDSVTDVENHETVGIAPIDEKLLSVEDPNAMSSETFDKIEALILAILMFVVIIAVKRYML